MAGLPPAPSLEDEDRLPTEMMGLQLTGDEAEADDETEVAQWQPLEFTSRSPGSRVFPSAVVHGGSLYVFGGHDGTVYRNDLLVFNFETRAWRTQTDMAGEPPSSRDAHAAVVYAEWMVVFGGYDSKRYLNDFHRYHFASATWSLILPAVGTAPSARGGHTAVVHGGQMFVFGGCDGWSYFNDTYAYHFERAEWAAVRITGTAPGARSAPATVVHSSRASMYVFGGYDGSRSLNDLFKLNLETCEWAHVRTTGVPPSPRGGHTAVVYRDSLYAFGGKSGRSPFNDLCGYEFARGAWTQVRAVAPVPAPRCAHVCVAFGSSLYVFGGYDGRRYFDDCYAFSFEPAGPNPAAALSLAGDLALMVNNSQFADIEFALDDGRRLCAHKSILFARSDYFRRMLTGGYREAADTRVQIVGVGSDAFLCVLAFLYTGKLPKELARPALPAPLALECLAAANCYGIEPLKRLCAEQLARALNARNAAAVLEAAEAHGAPTLRAATTDFIADHFSSVVRTEAFAELIRAESRELLLGVLTEVADRAAAAGPRSPHYAGSGLGGGVALGGLAGARTRARND